MKKLFVILAALALVWAFAAPASAVDWNFYGSARMATFYTSVDLGDAATTAGGDDEDDGTQWELQGNSRLGATVKGDNISGRVELGLKGLDGGDLDVGTRRIAGTWNFGAGTLKVGKDYSPVSQFISTQAFAGDLGLLGIGTFYGRRPAGLELGFGRLRIALLDPSTDYIAGLGATSATLTIVTGGVTFNVSTAVGANGDIDSYIPKMEASWGMSFDQFSFNVMGGFQYYEIEDVTSGVNGTTDDLDVTSYVIGADAGFSAGPFYIKGAVSYSQNPSDAGWYMNAYPGQAVWDGDDDTDDTDVIQGALVAGWKMSDTISFEVGAGMADYDTDAAGADDTTPWAVYGNATIQLAPGVWIIPEVGYFDNDDLPIDANDNDAGDLLYIGAKWQVDF
jgi:hypothetical protein